MVICIKRFLFYEIVNYQFKTRELKNVEKLVEQLLEWTGMCIVVQSVKLPSW